MNIKEIKMVNVWITQSKVLYKRGNKFKTFRKILLYWLALKFCFQRWRVKECVNQNVDNNYLWIIGILVVLFSFVFLVCIFQENDFLWMNWFLIFEKYISVSCLALFGVERIWGEMSLLALLWQPMGQVGKWFVKYAEY